LPGEVSVTVLREANFPPNLDNSKLGLSSVFVPGGLTGQESDVEIAANIELWNCDNQVVLRNAVDALSVDGIVIGATRRRGSGE
jgi:hypothetical protein